MTIKIEETKFHINTAIELLEYYYLNDNRNMCIAYSGGKDSTVLIYLVFLMLKSCMKKNTFLKEKIIHIINSNTLAELPPLLNHIQTSLSSINSYAKKFKLPIKVHEVIPEVKDTLNVQLLGVGMPPPSNSFRWCTDKLKVNPIDTKIRELFPSGEFISVIGTRKDESFDRALRIEKLSISGTNLKINNRYPNASNLMPIENWTTKDVWQYLFDQKENIVDIDFLWKLYSDASGKKGNECSFVAAGGKDIDEGKIGCGVSRFGCWQCYMVRDTDKSLDGLMNSGYEKIEFYKEYRDWFWKLTQQGWEITRDSYNHRTQIRDMYNKGGEDNIKYGMTMPKGLTLKIRKQSFKRLLKLQKKLDEEIITKYEIIEIQKRWLLEGDLELFAFKEARKYGYSMNFYSLEKKLQNYLINAKIIYKEKLNKAHIKKDFSVLTLKRFAIQQLINPIKIQNKFFPSKNEEKHIRKEWNKAKKIDKISFEQINLFNNLKDRLEGIQ